MKFNFSNKKLSRTLLIAIIFIVLMSVSVLVIRGLSEYEPVVTILFAKEDIEINTIITNENIIAKEVKIKSVHKNSITNKSDVVGKTALANIYKDEMILNMRVGELNEIENIEIVNSDNRVITVKLNPDQANGWILKTGQFVEILFVPNRDLIINDPEIPVVFKELVLNNIEVIENVRVAAIIDKVGNQIDNKKNRTLVPEYIALEVDKETAKFLAFAKTYGRIEVITLP